LYKLPVHCKKKQALVESGADRFERDCSSVVLFQLSYSAGVDGLLVVT